MIASKLREYVLSGGVDTVIIEQCTVKPENLEKKKERIAKALDSFIKLYGDLEVSILSVGGRSEISGNHTDHNRGKVLAAAIDLDILAVASPTDDGTVTVKSEGFPEDRVLATEIAAPI